MYGWRELRYPSLQRFTADIFIPFVTTRIVLTLVAWIAMHLVRVQAVPGAWELDQSGATVKVTSAVAPDTRPIINMWARWDAGWYFDVAAHGYKFVAGQPSNAAFYPLYPLLMRAVHVLLISKSDAGWMTAGIIVSNAALLFALWHLYLLTELELDRASACRAVLYVLIFPTTLFFSAVYTESLFLGCAIAAFYHARSNRWLLASVYGGAATLTRSPGVLLFLPLCYEYLAQREFKLDRVKWSILGLLFIPSVLMGYALFLYARFGNPMAIRDSQGTWGRILTPVWISVRDFFSSPLVVHVGAHSIIDFVFTVAAVLATIGIAVSFRFSYTLFALSVLLFITAWGSFVSVPRYVLASFPIFMLLGDLARKRLVRLTLLICFTMLATLFMIMFALWQWVA